MDNVRLETDDAKATVTIDRPAVMNAFDSKTRSELTSTLAGLKDDEGIRVVVITGAGDSAFSAGQDVSESREFGVEDATEWVAEWDALYAELLGFEVPVIAKLNGVAVGAAFQVALLCDLRIAAPHAKVGMPEIDIGIPCVLGSWMIERIAGYAPAAELSLTGEPIDPERAATLGLVTRVVPEEELDAAVDELAGELAAKSPVAMTWQKRWLRGLLFEEDVSEIMERGQEIHAEVYESGDPERYMSEFLE